MKKQTQTQTRFFTITQNAFDDYDIEIQSLLTQIGYVEAVQ